MTEALRRILLAVSEAGDLGPALDTAVSLASGLGSELQCLVVEHEDLFAAAGLPFSRAFGPGGLSLPLTSEGLDQHFRQLLRETEKEIAGRCERLKVPWQVASPRGNYIRELVAAAREGDIVVVSRRDLRDMREGLFAAVRHLLEKASAITVPAAARCSTGPVLLLLGNDQSGTAGILARRLSAASGARLDILSPAQLLLPPKLASIVVSSFAIAEEIGEAQFLRGTDVMGASALIVRE